MEIKGRKVSAGCYEYTTPIGVLTLAKTNLGLWYLKNPPSIPDGLYRSFIAKKDFETKINTIQDWTKAYRGTCAHCRRWYESNERQLGSWMCPECRDAWTNRKPTAFKRIEVHACATCHFLKYNVDSEVHVCQRDSGIEFVPSYLQHFFHKCELYRKATK